MSRTTKQLNPHQLLHQQELLRQQVQEILVDYDLQKDFTHQLQECFVQENTIATAAFKLNCKPSEITYWYYLISMKLFQKALQGC